MKNDKKTSKAGNPARLPLSKPGVFALIANIARATLSGGMLWFVFFGAVVVAFLHFNQVPAEHLLALLIAAIVVIAFVRGIREWQNELDEYQRELTEYRMNMADVRNKQQVKKDSNQQNIDNIRKLNMRQNPQHVRHVNTPLLVSVPRRFQRTCSVCFSRSLC